MGRMTLTGSMEEDLWNQEKKGKCVKVLLAGASRALGVDLAIAMAQPSAQKRTGKWMVPLCSLP